MIKQDEVGICKSSSEVNTLLSWKGQERDIKAFIKASTVSAAVAC